MHSQNPRNAPGEANDAFEITQREMNGIYLLALKRSSCAWDREQRLRA